MNLHSINRVFILIHDDDDFFVEKFRPLAIQKIVFDIGTLWPDLIGLENPFDEESNQLLGRRDAQLGFAQDA